jgi:hypothetical protein
MRVFQYVPPFAIHDIANGLDWTCGQQVFEFAASERGIDEDPRSFGRYATGFLDCTSSLILGIPY